MHYDSTDKRRRGTAIVETTEGILLTAGDHGSFMLPGGKAKGDESRIKAAARELHEETGLNADSTKFLFYHVGETNKRYHYQDHHKVCLIEASGRATPHHEIKRIAYYRPGCEIRVTADTKAIIERYYALVRGKDTIEIMSPKPSQSGPNDSNDNGKAYLTSDQHLEHTNIIRYCQRPFNTTTDMNNTLVNNWNNTVDQSDTIYFLGDFAPFKQKRRVGKWLKVLNGNIILIQGSHDPPNFGVSHIFLDYQSYRFLLVHNPSRNPKYGQSPIPPDWQGWIIHGHTHNKEMREYPFINGISKTINVSVELTDYRPISLEYLVSLGLDKIKRMDTIDSIPEKN